MAEPEADRSGRDRRAVLVTGAASGIGFATALRCRRDGWAVGLVDRDAAGLETAAAALRAGDGRRPQGGDDAVWAGAADVADGDAVRAAVDAAATWFGRLDAAVNVAGVGGSTGDVVATGRDDWDRTLAVNLTGVFLVSGAVVPHLRAAGGGRIVNVSSQFGLVGVAGSPAYAAAKSGVIGLTRAMAVDHAGEGILVNCVCPGPIDTPMLRASLADDGLAARRESARTAPRSLLGGPGRPEDVAGAISFLLGPDGGHLTGVVLPVDGGWTAG